VARKTRKMPSVDGWMQTSAARERKLWTARRWVATVAGGEEVDSKEEDEGEREGVVRGGAW